MVSQMTVALFLTDGAKWIQSYWVGAVHPGIRLKGIISPIPRNNACGISQDHQKEYHRKMFVRIMSKTSQIYKKI